MVSAYFCSTKRGLYSGEHLGGRAAAARCHPRQLRNKQTGSDCVPPLLMLSARTQQSFRAVTGSEVGTLVIDCEVFWCLEGSHISKGFCDEELRFMGLLLILGSVRRKNGLI